MNQKHCGHAHEAKREEAETAETLEIQALMQSAFGKTAALLEFVEYVAELNQPVPAEVSLRILKAKANQLLEENA